MVEGYLWYEKRDDLKLPFKYKVNRLFRRIKVFNVQTKITSHRCKVKVETNFDIFFFFSSKALISSNPEKRLPCQSMLQILVIYNYLLIKEMTDFNYFVRKETIMYKVNA